ncbi:amidase family protein [Fodinicola acaciae]|uniref:amidase family protein n=1 Tax=Fodinicola acaciae TaxID=2681555 RepID=UPI001C9E3311|nr:amidase family protein [Fodinicola acaciae]
MLDDPGCPVSTDVGAALSNAIDAIGQAGATIVPGWPDGVDPVVSTESFAFQVGLFFAFAQPDGTEDTTLANLIEQEARRMAARAAWTRYFADIDVFVCPTNFTTAFPHDQRPFDARVISTTTGPRAYLEQPFWIAQPSLPGLPAVAAPIGATPTGLPVGAQIIGPLYEDDNAITFAELLADIIGGFQPPDIDKPIE